MSNFLGYFWDGPQGLTTLCLALVVMAALKVVGAAVAGPGRATEADPVVGWAVLAYLLTAANALFRLPLTPFAWAYLATAAGCVLLLRRRGERPFAPGIWKVLVLALPLLLLASAKGVSEWDEFSQWLATPKFLLATDGFPSRATPLKGVSFQAYPYNWPMLTYMVGRLAGRFVENAGGVLNVLVVLSFAPMALRLAWMGLGCDRPPAWTWGTAALAVALATVLNPVWVQKIILTAYADPASAVSLGFAGVLAWMALGALAAGERAKARTFAWQMGLALAVLINVKQANLVLVVMVLGGAGLAALRDPDVRLADAAKLLPAALLPPAAIYVIWRHYVATEIPGREFGLLPFDNWAIGHLGQIVWTMATVAAKKTVYFTIMAAATVAGLIALVRFKGAFGRLAIIVGATFLGYNLFLLFVYVAVMGVGEGTHAASYWRYNMHLGALASAFAAYGLADLWRRRIGGRSMPRWAAPALIAVVLIAPIALAPKLRFDLEMPKAHFLKVARAVAARLPEGARVHVLDPTGSGESGIMLSYAIGGHARFTGWMSAFHGPTGAKLDDAFRAKTDDYLLVHSLVPGSADAARLGLKDKISYLLARQADGEWKVVASWPYAASP